MGPRRESSAVDETVPAPVSSARISARDSQPAIGSARDHAQLLPIDASHYDLGGELARGGMGRIVKARDRRLGRPVAIKELLAQPDVDVDTAAREDRRARFEREARITARLQHPSIVSVLEAGTTETGEPFYVMRLVTGTSLDVAIAARPTLAGRLALLPNLIAAADALAYAHSLRIVHRDLKPANVLVGEFGETVVIDWGLAKDLAASGDDAATEPAATTSGVGETVLGAVMGTPAYMPREQAMGAAVDERADVYALGAILYQLLANRAPYAAATSREVLALVLAGGPEPIAKAVPRLSRDLVAIVDKAMARDTADRYATAKELADDLKKFQTGQLVGAHRYTAWQLVRRWVRRHRGAVAVGTLAVGVLAAFGIASALRIVREQEQTEDERRDAEELASFMLNDLQVKLKPSGRIDVLEETARHAIAHYEKRVGPTPTLADVADRVKLSRAYVLLGDAHSSSGHTDETLVEYARAGALLDGYQLAGLPTDDAQAVREGLSISLDRLAEAKLGHGDSEGAMAGYRAGLALDEARLAADPTNDVIAENIVISHHHIGALLDRRGQTEAALAEYRTALAIVEGVVRSHPSSHRYQMALAQAHMSVGDDEHALGDAANARAEIATALAIGAKVIEADPDNVHWWSLQAAFEAAAARAVEDDSAAALAHFQKAHALNAKLLLREPDSAVYGRAATIVARAIGNIDVQHGQVAEGIAELRESTAAADRLAADDRADVDAQTLAGDCHRDLASALAAQHDHAGALAELIAAQAILEPASALAPTDVSVIASRAQTRVSQGGELAALGRTAEATAAIADGIAIATERVTREGTDEARGALSSVQDLAGDVLAAAGDRAGALVHYKAERDLDTIDLAHAPADRERIEELAASTDKVAHALLESGDAAAAVVELRASLALSVRRAVGVAEADPMAGDLQLSLGKRHAALGAALLHVTGAAARAEAVTETQAAIAILEATRPHVDPSVELDAELAKARAQLAAAAK